VEIKPLKRIALSDGPSITIYGRKTDEEITNWNLLQLRAPRGECRGFHQKFAEVCRQSPIKTYYAPRPADFNKKIAGLDEFGWCFHFGSTNVLGRPNADGIILPLWHGFMISSADCPTTILWSTESKKTVVFHSGRDSLLDWRAIKHNCGSHLVESVAKTAVKQFHREDPANLRFFNDFLCSSIVIK